MKQASWVKPTEKKAEAKPQKPIAIETKTKTTPKTEDK